MKRTLNKFPYIERGIPPTGGNFYPASISIQDGNRIEGNKNKVTIFLVRSQGGTGYIPGSLILQKMSYSTDNRGLTENLSAIESMNTNNFKTTHFIILGTNINNNVKKDSNNKYMIQKTDMINFIYNYFNVATLLFKIDQINNNTRYEGNIKKENELREIIYKNIKVSPDIRANYELINNNLVIGEYFRYNYFFNFEKNNESDDKTFGLFSLNFDDNTNFKIYSDEKGFNYGYSIDIEINNKLISPKGQNFSIKKNEFLYIYYYFDV